VSIAEHIVMLPIVLPLAAGAITLVLDEERVALRAGISLGAALLLVAAAVALVGVAGGSFATVYRVGNWPAPFGIVLVVDRVAAILVLLTSVLGVASLVFSLARWDRAGPRFHSLVQFLMMGVNGAFLTERARQEDEGHLAALAAHDRQGVGAAEAQIRSPAEDSVNSD